TSDLEERGIWAGHSKRIVGPTGQRFFNQRIVRCIVYRRSTRAAHSFPSLRRFLTLAPACWSRGKIPPHPSARSARHSSPQNGGPKGKMIGGAHARPRRLYCVPLSTQTGSAYVSTPFTSSSRM